MTQHSSRATYEALITELREAQHTLQQLYLQWSNLDDPMLCDVESLALFCNGLSEAQSQAGNFEDFIHNSVLPDMQG